MQDPTQDTQWNDVLRAKGIIPQKEAEVTEEQIQQMVDKTISKHMGNKRDIEELDLDELDLLEDEEDERVLLEYRQKRLAEIKAEMSKSRFGDVREISAQDYKEEVNNAGKGIWVILHLYQHSTPLCKIINQHLNVLAQKFPTTKFLRSIATNCIPNYPERHVPTIFVYREGQMVKQFIGPETFGGATISQDVLEWMLAETGAVKTTLESNPRPRVKDALFSQLGSGNGYDHEDSGSDGDNNDW